MKATDVIRRDHQAVEDLFATFKAASAEDQEAMTGEIFDTLTAHETMEDTYFYPAVRDKLPMELLISIEAEQKKLEVETIAARALPGDRAKRILEMMDVVVAHAKREQAEILPKAEEALSEAELEELGAKMEPESASAKA